MKRLLVVVDYQHDFVDGSLGFDGAELLDERIANRMLEYSDDYIVCTRDTHSEDYLRTLEGRLLPVEHCINGTKGHELYGKVAQTAEKTNAVILDKVSFGLDISDSNTVARLPREVREIELCGLVSNICVLSNAVIFRTLYPQAALTVDASLTASFDSVLNDKALDVLKGLQVRVINSES